MIKFGKMVKSLHFFSKQQRILSKWNLFCFGQIVFNFACTFPAHLKKKALFLRFFKVSIDHLFDSLESGKRKYCFGEKSN